MTWSRLAVWCYIFVVVSGKIIVQQCLLLTCKNKMICFYHLTNNRHHMWASLWMNHSVSLCATVHLVLIPPCSNTFQVTSPTTFIIGQSLFPKQTVMLHIATKRSWDLLFQILSEMMKGASQTQRSNLKCFIW